MVIAYFSLGLIAFFSISLFESPVFAFQKNNWWENYNSDNLGVIIEPIADMLVAPLTASERYDSLQFTTDKTLNLATPRVHQCLYNELIFNLKLLGKEYFGEVSHAYYGVNLAGKWVNDYFTQKKNIIPLTVLKEKGVDLALIPPPVLSSNVLTLIKPWYDAQTKSWYSVGTRFVRMPLKDTKNNYGIAYIDFKNYCSLYAQIPCTSVLLLTDIPKDDNQKKKLMIDLIRLWIKEAKNAGGRLAYILGGSSFTQPYAPISQNVSEAVVIKSDNKIETNKKSLLSWTPNNSQASVWNGFDCSELIWRVANIVGIDYRYKNTSMISLFLKPLEPLSACVKNLKNSKNEKMLQVGDLLWMTGHVMIITDIEKGLIIEAGGYMWPVGEVHEVPLKDVFKNIKNYEDLINAYTRKIPLIRIGKSGKKIEYDSYELFRFSDNSTCNDS